MQETKLRKHHGDTFTTFVVWTEGPLFRWLSKVEKPGQILSNDRGAESKDSDAAADAAAVEKIASLKSDGFEELAGAAPRAAEAPSASKASKPLPAFLDNLPRDLASQRRAMLKRAREKGLLSRYPEMEPFLRAGADLKLKKSSNPAGVVSRLGGSPDLPGDFTWPEVDGAPLAFVAQLVVEDIKAFDVEDVLPKSGVLSFFAQLDPDRPDYGDACFVAHFADVKKLKRREPPSERAAPITKIGALTPKPRLMLPARENPWIEELGLNRNESRIYHDDFFAGLVPEGRHHQVLGWPNASVHHEMKGKRFLAQFDSDHHLDFEMGDYDTLRFFIDGDKVTPASLKTATCTLSEG